jgi:hypothetical protein
MNFDLSGGVRLSPDRFGLGFSSYFRLSNHERSRTARPSTCVSSNSATRSGGAAAKVTTT